MLLTDLKWYRVKVVLINERMALANRTHFYTVIESMMKAVCGKTGIDKSHLVFHTPGRRYSFKIRKGVHLPVDFLFFTLTKDEVLKWKNAFVDYFLDEARFKLNYYPWEVNDPEARSLTVVKTENKTIQSKGELCLDFFSPFQIKQDKSKWKGYLSKNDFISSIEKRIEMLFGKKISYKAGADSFELLPYYWEQVSIHHPSASSPGTTQHIKGFAGKLYLKGSYASFLPFLLLASEIHCGTKRSNSQGYFRFRNEHTSFFMDSFPSEKAIVQASREAIENYDYISDELLDEAGSIDETKIASKIVEQLKKRKLFDKPNIATEIPKTNGGKRIIEKPSPLNLIIQYYILKLIAPVFDRFFENESLGYRKCSSVNTAIDEIEKALSDGYHYVFESDIDDFFPSVDHGVLEQLLLNKLPDRDSVIIGLIMQIISLPFILSQKYEQRNRGLSLGSPLSPLLANFYLDTFDEAVKKQDVRLVRFADDFLIMAKTGDVAKKMLDVSKEALTPLQLSLKKDKTHVKHIGDGFRFLGVYFDSEGKQEPGFDEFRLLTKPLYVTESYAYLSLHGETLQISKHSKILVNYPLRRLNALILLENASVSTPLMRKCCNMGTPITLTLGTGYFVTTIKPDRKDFFELSAKQYQRYSSLSEAENLLIAKAFAEHKLLNIKKMISQRYRKGHALVLQKLDQFVAKIEQAADINAVRGLEGAATKLVYARLNSFINNTAFYLTKRERLHKDPINTLLNFGFYLLFANINTTLRVCGLNPYLGFLHSPANRYESLVADIEEVFRAHVLRLIVRLINLKVITESDFVIEHNRMFLNRSAKKRFILHFETMLEKPINNTKLTMRKQIFMQVLQFKFWALENRFPSFFKWE